MKIIPPHLSEIDRLILRITLNQIDQEDDVQTLTKQGFEINKSQLVKQFKGNLEQQLEESQLCQVKVTKNYCKSTDYALIPLVIKLVVKHESVHITPNPFLNKSVIEELKKSL